MSIYEIANFVFVIAILLSLIDIITMDRTIKKYNRRLDNLESRISALLKESEEKPEEPEEPGELKYVGYSSHDDESRYQCPICKEGYGSWDFINGSVRVMNGLFRCKCGKLLKKPE